MLFPLVLGACLPADMPARPGPQGAMTLPPVDGQSRVFRRDPHDYSISRTQTSHGFELRVTRMARDFDYSEGLLAKKVAEDFCGSFNRGLSPRAMARFSQPNSWVFDGDCA